MHRDPSYKGFDYGQPRYGMDTFTRISLINAKQPATRQSERDPTALADSNGEKVCQDILGGLAEEA